MQRRTRLAILATATVISAGAGLGIAAAHGSPDPTPVEWSPIALPAELPPLGQVLYGETSYRDDNGTVQTIIWQHGQVTSASPAAITVRSADGTEWTWTLNADTKISKNGETAQATDIAQNDTVRISGRRDGSTRTAATIADPPPDFTKVRERLKNLPDLPRLHPR